MAAAVLFSTGGAAIKACTLPGWHVAALRSGFAAVALLLMLPEARRRWRPGSVAVGAAYAATMVTFVLATKLTTAANAIFLQSTAPLYVLFLAPLLLGEALRARDVLLAAAFAAGLVLVFQDGPAAAATAPDPGRGDAIALASGLTWALTLLGLRWLGAHGRPAGTGPALVCGNVIACLACLPLAPALGAVALGDWLVLAYLGVVQIGLAYVCLSAGVRHVRALEVSLLLLLEPVLNPLWTWLVHGERPGAWSVAGGAVILAATAVVARAGVAGGGRATFARAGRTWQLRGRDTGRRRRAS